MGSCRGHGELKAKINRARSVQPMSPRFGGIPARPAPRWMLTGINPQPREATMPDPAPTSRHRAHQPSTGGGNTVYALGLIGALVYFYRQADSVHGYLLGTLKAIV